MKKYNQVEKLRIIKDLLNLFRKDAKRSVTLLNRFKKQEIKVGKDKDGKIISVELKEIPNDIFETFVASVESYIRSHATEKAIKDILAGTYVEEDKQAKEVKAKVKEKIKVKAKDAKKAKDKVDTSTGKTKIYAYEYNEIQEEINKFLEDKDKEFIKNNINILVKAFENDSRIKVTINNVIKQPIDEKIHLILLGEMLFRRKPANKLAMEAYKNLGLVVSVISKEAKAAKIVENKDKKIPAAPKKETKVTLMDQVKKSSQEKKDAKQETIKQEETKGDNIYEILEFDVNEYFFKNSIERKLSPAVVGKVISNLSIFELVKEFEENRNNYLNIKNELYLINNNENLYIVGTNTILNLLKLVNENKIPFTKKPTLLEKWNVITKKYGNVVFSDLKEFVKYQYEIISNIGNKAEVNLLNRELLFEFLALLIPENKQVKNPGLFFTPYFISMVGYDFENLAKTKITEEKEVIQFTINSKGINFVFDNEQYSIDNTREDFHDIKKYVEEGKVEELRKVLKNKVFLEQEIQEISGDDIIKIIDNKILCNGVIFTGNQVLKYLDFMKSGNLNDLNSLKRFFYNLSLNPEIRAQEELFNFVTVNNLRITNHGTVILYKWVRNNYKDQHTGRFDNKPGSKVWMDRKQVDNNKNNTCSRGLHICSFGYSKFSDKLVLVELHPRDCVSIPTDYNHSKMRCSEYKVLIDITEYYNEMSRTKDFLVIAKDLHHNPLILEEQIMECYPNIKRTNSFTGRNDKSWNDIKDTLTVPEEFSFELVRGEEVSQEEMERIEAEMRLESAKSLPENITEEVKEEVKEEVSNNEELSTLKPSDLGTIDHIKEPKVEPSEEEIGEPAAEACKEELYEALCETNIVKLLENYEYKFTYKDLGEKIVNEIRSVIKNPDLKFGKNDIIGNPENIATIINQSDSLNLDKIILNRCLGIHWKSDKTINDLEIWKLILIDYIKTVDSSNSIINEDAEYTKLNGEKNNKDGDTGFVKKIGAFFGKLF